MSDALESCSGCSTYYTVFSYTLFSWSLNTVQVETRAFLASVSTCMSKDVQTDRGFPSAHSSHTQTFSAPSAFGHIGVRAWAHKPFLLGGLLRLAPALCCQSRGDDKGRQFSLLTRLMKPMFLCRSLCGCVQVNYCKPCASSVWQAKDCSINTSFWKLFLY